MKTKEELNAIKEEIETLNSKLAELSKEELKQVVGGDGGYREYTLGETLMYCEVCKKSTYWPGFFVDQRFDCPMCSAINSLIGRAYR